MTINIIYANPAARALSRELCEFVFATLRLSNNMYKALAEHLLVDYYSFRVKKVEKEVRNLARKAFIFPILPGVEEG